VTATRSSSPETLLKLAQQRLQRLINEGVTTVEIKSGYGLNAEAEEKMLQVARQLSLNNPIDISPTLLAAHAVPPEYRQDPDAYLTLVCEQILPTLWQKELFEAVDVFCENVGFTPSQTERLFKAPTALGIPVKGHVEQLSNQGGAALVSRIRAFRRSYRISRRRRRSGDGAKRHGCGPVAGRVLFSAGAPASAG
jgi:imidazolonepropionase